MSWKHEMKLVFHFRFKSNTFMHLTNTLSVYELSLVIWHNAYNYICKIRYIYNYFLSSIVTSFIIMVKCIIWSWPTYYKLWTSMDGKIVKCIFNMVMSYVYRTQHLLLLHHWLQLLWVVINNLLYKTQAL